MPLSRTEERPRVPRARRTAGNVKRKDIYNPFSPFINRGVPRPRPASSCCPEHGGRPFASFSVRQSGGGLKGKAFTMDASGSIPFQGPLAVVD